MLKQCEVKKGSKTRSGTVTHHTLQTGVGKTRQTWRDRKGWTDTLGNTARQKQRERDRDRHGKTETLTLRNTDTERDRWTHREIDIQR